MPEQRSVKRLPRVDALVIGAVCLFLIALAPFLRPKSREQYIRLTCKTNLYRIGQAMFVYANDYQDALPRAGGPTTTWGPVAMWTAPDRHRAFGLAADGSGGRASISSSLYLLVKHYEMPTKSFVCEGDKGTTEFKPSDLLMKGVPDFTLADAWDFGPPAEAFKHSSYAYHIPYGLYPVTASRDPNLAVAADRNPYFKSPMADPAPLAVFKPDLDMYRGTPEQACAGNAVAHGRDGQNVLFLDGHVTFEKRSYCGLDTDNIYLVSTDLRRGSPLGCVPVPPAVVPANERDSVLVHDPDVWGFGSPSSKP